MTRTDIARLISNPTTVSVYSISHVCRSGKIDKITGIPRFDKTGWVLRGEIDGNYRQIGLRSKHVFASRADAIRAARSLLQAQAEKFLILAKELT